MISTFFLAIVVTSLATYLSRSLGVVTSQKISEDSKIFRWFNCLAYSTLAALIARIVIYPLGVLADVDFYFRLIIVLLCIIMFFTTKKNLVYPTVFSCILLSALSAFFKI